MSSAALKAEDPRRKNDPCAKTAHETGNLTILWLEKGHGRWDKLHTREELVEKLQEIESNPDACSISDVLILRPAADYYASAENES